MKCIPKTKVLNVTSKYAKIGANMSQIAELERQAIRRYMKIRQTEGKIDKETAVTAKKTLEKLRQLLEVMGPEFRHSFVVVNNLFMELEDCGY